MGRSPQHFRCVHTSNRFAKTAFLFTCIPGDGPVYGEFLEQVRADVNDPEFLKRFQQSKVLTACRVELELR